MAKQFYNKPHLIFISLIVLSSISFLTAQTLIQSTSSEQRMKMYDNHVKLKEASLFKNLNWQFVGPTNISGRMTDIAVSTPKGKNYTIYVGGATGGAWKTTNEGVTWDPIFEHGPSTSIGDITLAPSNQDIVWIGTGEANIFRSSNAGAGVFKSTDAGKTWNHMGLVSTNTIPRIVIHPTNPDIVYVAAGGNQWTNNQDRGLYKTVDGGKTGKKVFYKNEKTGVIDLVIDNKDPNILYLATWQRVRKKWNDPRNEKDYNGSSIYKSVDAGKTWNEISNGLPEEKYRGRIGIDICRSNPNVLYAFVDNYEISKVNDDKENTDSYGRPKGGVIRGATVFRTDDKGKTWKQVSEKNEFMEGLAATYGWVFGQITVDPTNENRVFIMGLGLNESTDGGRTYKEIGDFHGDMHGLWIDPANNNYMVEVNDGGVVVSYDSGKNWREFTENFPLVQFFNISADMSKPFNVYGSIQDHGSFTGVVDISRGRDNIPLQKFKRSPGWEGSIHQIDPTNQDIVYAASFYGSISRTNVKTDESKDIMPKVGKDEPKLRGQWLAPFIISKFNPNHLYMGFQYVFKTTNQGDSWERISGDLTYNDPSKSGDIPYQTIYSISESPLRAGIIYAGTDDGRVHVTKDDGKNWKEIVKGLPYGKWVSELAASAYDVNTVYLSQNGKRDDDFAPYLWKSTDNGDTWISIVNNLPTGPINVIKEDPANKNMLYVGNDFGVYVSLNQGKSWHVLPGKLPTTYVHDLAIQSRDNIMVIGTHGRGVWALDVEYLQKLSEEDLQKDFFVLKTENGMLPQNPKSRWSQSKPAKFGFFVKGKHEINISVLDSAGIKVKEIKMPCEAGMNFGSWDLTKDAKEKAYVEKGEFKLSFESDGKKREIKLMVEKPAKR